MCTSLQVSVAILLESFINVSRYVHQQYRAVEDEYSDGLDTLVILYRKVDMEDARTVLLSRMKNERHIK
jgi:hypothetical protein